MLCEPLFIRLAEHRKRLVLKKAVLAYFLPNCFLHFYWAHLANRVHKLKSQSLESPSPQNPPLRAVEFSLVTQWSVSYTHLDVYKRQVWMTVDEIRNQAHLMRSPQVLTCIEDYLAGKQFPLSVLTHL